MLWSTAGLFVRLLDLDVSTILAWRSLFAALIGGGLVLASVVFYLSGALGKTSVQQP